MLCLHCNTSPLGCKSLNPFCAYIQWVLVRRKVISSKCPCRYSALHLCTVSTQFLSQWLRQRLPGLRDHNPVHQGFKFTASKQVGWLGNLNPNRTNQTQSTNQPNRSWCLFLRQGAPRKVSKSKVKCSMAGGPNGLSRFYNIRRNSLQIT